MQRERVSTDELIDRLAEVIRVLGPEHYLRAPCRPPDGLDCGAMDVLPVLARPTMDEAGLDDHDLELVDLRGFLGLPADARTPRPPVSARKKTVMKDAQGQPFEGLALRPIVRERLSWLGRIAIGPGDVCACGTRVPDDLKHLQRQLLAPKKPRARFRKR